MTERPLIGIDPGATGALVLYTRAKLRVFDVPIVKVKRGRTEKSRVDGARLVQILELLTAFDPAAVYFEDTQGMPGQSAPAAHAFGQTCGIIEGVCHALKLPVLMVHSATWKAALRVPSGKDAARAVASRLMPQHAHHWPLGKHDGRAEAAMIAMWGSIHGVLK